MPIEIIDEPVIRLTRAEYDGLLREYSSSMAYTASPVSFETWLLNRKQQQEFVKITCL